MNIIKYYILSHVLLFTFSTFDDGAFIYDVVFEILRSSGYSSTTS